MLWSAPRLDAERVPFEFAGLGAARVLRARGPERLQELRARLKEVYAAFGVQRGAAESGATESSAAQSGAAEGARELPRVWGGLSFVPGRGAGSCWESFGDATFVLPRWHYEDRGGVARLGVVAEPSELARQELLDEGEALWAALHEGAPRLESQRRTAELERRESTSRDEWAALVASIREGIARGVVEKVVAARRSTLRLSPAPRPVEVFERLGELAPGCTRFALRIGQRTFLGATPERLVRREGRRVETHAIAGSIAADLADGAERLLASAKDRAEHAYVVSALRKALEPLCESLDVSSVPEVRRLRHVLHLQTPLSGRLAGDTHVLELVERLHPTPAVGGSPTAPALDWIARAEPAERGWYASPVGWVDAAGDGELVVALRSALILEDRVHLYAGAGIVAGSEAESEYAETEIKLAGMRAALGVSASGESHATS